MHLFTTNGVNQIHCGEARFLIIALLQLNKLTDKSACFSLDKDARFKQPAISLQLDCFREIKHRLYLRYFHISLILNWYTINDPKSNEHSLNVEMSTPHISCEDFEPELHLINIPESCW